MKHLKKRFILFNILVMSCVLLVFAVLVGVSERSSLSAGRFILAAFVCFGLVLISSLILSNIAIAPIKTAWQKQLDFTSDASHELRTPLSTIQMNLDVVLSNPKATVESQRKWLENIKTENKRMSALVSSLLLLSRSDTGEAVIQNEILNLSDLVTEVAGIYKLAAKQSGLQLTSQIGEQIIIQGDGDRLKQLFVILIDNAIKYTEPDGEIQIGLSREGSYAVINVADTGIGILKEDMERIFDRFYRGKQARLTHTEGSGLGLAIADFITREHGGRMTVENRVGKGSVFTVRIPVHQAVNQERVTGAIKTL